MEDEQKRGNHRSALMIRAGRSSSLLIAHQPVLPGPTSLLLLVVLILAAVALVNRTRRGTNNHGAGPNQEDRGPAMDNSFGSSDPGGSSAPHHPSEPSASVNDQPDGTTYDSASLDAGQDMDNSSSDSADTGGGDSSSDSD